MLLLLPWLLLPGWLLLLLLLRLVRLLLLLLLLCSRLLLLLLVLLTCSRGIWSLETLPADSDDFGKIRPNVLLLLGVSNSLKKGVSDYPAWKHPTSTKPIPSADGQNPRKPRTPNPGQFKASKIKNTVSILLQARVTNQGSLTGT